MRPLRRATDELFPIREVVRLTGVNPVTLRAWERRYGLIQPVRTEGGHRLYSQADIEAIRSIVDWTERGVAVSKVGSLLERSAASKAEPWAAEAEPLAGEWGEWQARVRQAVDAFDEARLEQLYGQVFSTYPLSVVFEAILSAALAGAAAPRGVRADQSLAVFRRVSACPGVAAPAPGAAPGR